MRRPETKTEARSLEVTARIPDGDGAGEPVAREEQASLIASLERLMSKIYLWAGTCVLFFAFVTPAFPEMQPARVGELACDIGPRIGTVSERVSCVFRPDATRRQYYHTGRIARSGVDVGVTGGGRLVWEVFAPTSHVDPGVLRGRYVGASDDTSPVLGLGVNALVGGSNRRIVLRPMSVEDEVGVNLAAGVAGMTLR